jgi:hypothetical protein
LRSFSSIVGLGWIINPVIETVLKIYSSEEAISTLSDRFLGDWLKVNQTAYVNT